MRARGMLLAFFAIGSFKWYYAYLETWDYKTQDRSEIVRYMWNILGFAARYRDPRLCHHVSSAGKRFTKSPPTCLEGEGAAVQDHVVRRTGEHAVLCYSQVRGRCCPRPRGQEDWRACSTGTMLQSGKRALLSKTTWSGGLESMQYYATVR
jgi:hypothetical protein